MSRIAEFKKQSALITNHMVTFALDPTLDKYNAICKCESLIRTSGEFFPLFRDTCLLCYGDLWGIHEDSLGLNTDTNITETITNLKEAAVRAPTLTIATKLMYVFYASGQLAIIELFYQCMGCETMQRHTKEQLAQLYRDVKNDWQKCCAGLLRKNPSHFDNMKIRPDVADFSYFDNIKERAIEERERKFKIEDV